MFKRKEAQITRRKAVLIEGYLACVGQLWPAQAVPAAQGTHRAVVIFWAQLTALLAPL